MAEPRPQSVVHRPHSTAWSRRTPPADADGDGDATDVAVPAAVAT